MERSQFVEKAHRSDLQAREHPGVTRARVAVTISSSFRRYAFDVSCARKNTRGRVESVGGPPPRKPSCCWKCGIGLGIMHRRIPRAGRPGEIRANFQRRAAPAGTLHESLHPPRRAPGPRRSGRPPPSSPPETLPTSSGRRWLWPARDPVARERGRGGESGTSTTVTRRSTVCRRALVELDPDRPRLATGGTRSQPCGPS